jgi:hypothetical protein
LVFRLGVFDASHPGEAEFTSAPFSGTMQFITVSRLKIRLVRIRYENAERNMDVEAPTVANFWTTAQYTLKTWPISGIQIVRDSVELYDGDFTGFFDTNGPGVAGTTGSIMTIFRRLRDAEDFPKDVRYYLLFPVRDSLGNAVNQAWAGHAAGRASTGGVFDGTTMAQELGHNYRGDSDHAPCGNPNSPDPDYPDYDPYPGGSIGEYGFDIVNGTVYDPNFYADFMSYCSPRWVSPYTYETLMKRLPTETSGAIIPAGAVQPRELLYLSFTIYRNGEVVPKGPGFHRESFIENLFPARQRQTPYFVELHDDAGRILEAQRLEIEDYYKSLDDGYLEFDPALPWHEEAAQVVFKKEEQVLDSIDIELSTPEVGISFPSGGETLRGEQTISWKASSDENYLRHVLLYSNDHGDTWQAIATDLTDSEYTVDFHHLPGGKSCLIRVLASGGIRTGEATSNTFSVPRTPRSALIVSPGDGDIFVQGESVHLFGVTHTPGESLTEPDAIDETLNWSSSVDGFLGAGTQLIVHALSVGRHRLTLEADDAHSGEASKSIFITVRPRES